MKHCRIIIATILFSFLNYGMLAQRSMPANVPITFYGKAVDQYNQPVTNAVVKFVVGVIRAGEDDTAEQSMTLTTGKDGLFTLTGVTGYAIDKISIIKDGYELSQKASRGVTFGFMPHYIPDATNPLIFKMWQQAGKEPLANSAWHGKVACDGTTNRFDLATGHSQAEGNLELSCTRTPLNYEPIKRQPYDYKFEVTLVGGGVQSTKDEFTYLAPLEGYSPVLTIERKSGDAEWSAGIFQEFYIKTADGNYGCLSVRWDAGHRPSPTILEWNCSVNPSGSRNLER